VETEANILWWVIVSVGIVSLAWMIFIGYTILKPLHKAGHPIIPTPDPRCADCHRVPHPDFIVQDEIWAMVATPASSAERQASKLCLPCLRKRIRVRLGRDLYLEDFTGDPRNALFWLGTELERKASGDCSHAG